MVFSIPKNNQFEKRSCAACWPIKTELRRSAPPCECWLDVSLLVIFNHAIDGVIQNNPKARVNPKARAGRLQETTAGVSFN
jgi:hypothetical protein